MTIMLRFKQYVFIKLMFKLIIPFLVLGCVFALNIEEFNKEKLEQLRLYADYQHHFIFVHEPTLEAIKSRLAELTALDIKFYLNDCKINRLPECEHPEQQPVVLLFNRILIRFNGNPQAPEQILEWAEKRIYSSPKYINTREELDAHLETHPNSFCFCQPPNRIEDSGLFYVMSKSLPHQNYCILNNVVTMTEIGLKENNITLFLNNATNRREFQHPNRFQSWQWFVKANILPSVPRAQNIINDRFAHKEKNINAVVLVCDFGIHCDPVWQAAGALQSQLNKENLGYDFYLALQDQKESIVFYLYYHLKINLAKLPALVHIQLKSNGENAGNPVRHVQYIKQFNRAALDNFVTNTQKGLIPEEIYSAPLPKNNGFYGKASQKFIQKVVASNVLSTIAASENHYLLLVTALNIQCDACETFYKQFKQIASLLLQRDITFALLNANENQVPVTSVTQLPQVLLFKKDDKANPIRFNVNHSFDHLMLFLKNNLGEHYVNPQEL